MFAIFTGKPEAAYGVSGFLCCCDTAVLLSGRICPTVKPASLPAAFRRLKTDVNFLASARDYRADFFEYIFITNKLFHIITSRSLNTKPDK